MTKPASVSFYNYLQNYIGSADGVQKVTSGISYGTKWMGYFPDAFSQHTLAVADRVGTDFGMVSSSMSFPGFVTSTIDFKNSYQKLELTSNFSETEKKTIDTGMGALCYGLDCTSFLNSRHIIDLKDAAPQVEGAFWASWGYLAVSGFYEQQEKAEVNVEKAKANSGDISDHYWRKADQSYLTILNNVAVIGMCAVALISLIFAALVEGSTLVPLLALGFSTAYVLLSILCYFHGRMTADMTPAGLKI